MVYLETRLFGWSELTTTNLRLFKYVRGHRVRTFFVATQPKPNLRNIKRLDILKRFNTNWFNLSETTQASQNGRKPDAQNMFIDQYVFVYRQEYSLFSQPFMSKRTQWKGLLIDTIIELLDESLRMH